MSKASLARKGLKAGLRAGKRARNALTRSKPTASGAVKPRGSLGDAAKPLGYAAAASAPFLAAGVAIDRYGKARNPRLQTIDLDGDKLPDLTFDSKTGKKDGYGPAGAPSHEGDNDRSDDDTRDKLVLAGVVSAIAIAVVLVVRGR